MPPLTGYRLVRFMEGAGIKRANPFGRTPASGEDLPEDELDELLDVGDAVEPSQSPLDLTPQETEALFAKHGWNSCFPMTPDGHMLNHHPIAFDAQKACEQLIKVWEAEIVPAVKQELLTACWLGCTYHNRDHPGDFGGLFFHQVLTAVFVCVLDIKLTLALLPSSQRAKLEQRARELKLGSMAQTVTETFNNGYSNYPGRGTPGLIVTLLYNPVNRRKRHSGYSLGWFFDIRKNYQASAAVWGWGGPRGVKLPEKLVDLLQNLPEKSSEQRTTYFDLLARFEDYGQFKDQQGLWDRPTLRATLAAFHFASRYLIMSENPVAHADASVANLQPPKVKRRLSLVELEPGESLASYYGRQVDVADEELAAVKATVSTLQQQNDKADKALKEQKDKADKALKEKEKADKALKEQKDKADKALKEEKEKADKALKEKEKADKALKEEKEKAEASLRKQVERRRQRGHADAEIAADLDCSLSELLSRFPRSDSPV